MTERRDGTPANFVYSRIVFQHIESLACGPDDLSRARRVSWRCRMVASLPDRRRVRFSDVRHRGLKKLVCSGPLMASSQMPYIGAGALVSGGSFTYSQLDTDD